MTFQTSMNALSADAARWSETSDMLDTASSAAGDMTLRLEDFTFAGGDVLAAYEEMRSFVQDYLTGGRRTSTPTTCSSTTPGRAPPPRPTRARSGTSSRRSMPSARAWPPRSPRR
jgi:hypothetical protein